ncbi:MAG: hypothetical protein J2P50_15115, partial [Hyphomicrobiaceae bacterium]|nr:hypothetical protein [Hyphomicrobiaceae bacterium]
MLDAVGGARKARTSNECAFLACSAEHWHEGWSDERVAGSAPGAPAPLARAGDEPPHPRRWWGGRVGSASDPVGGERKGQLDPPFAGMT